MKSPFADCEAVLMRETRELTYRNEKFQYEASFYRCEQTGIEFSTTQLDDENLEKVYEQYRREHGIPSPEEIRNTRVKYRLSAAKMSAILGLGTNQYRLYEGGEMPSLSVGKVLMAIRKPEVFRVFVINSSDELKPDEVKAILDKIDDSTIEEKMSRSWVLLTQMTVSRRHPNKKHASVAFFSSRNAVSFCQESTN